MKILRLLLLAIFLPGLAWAQSSPGLYNGQVPTAAQWNSYFQKKQDYPVSGFCPTASVFANFTGGTAAARCVPASTVVGVGSALKWVAPITLSLSGAVTGTGSVDGSGNVTIATSGGSVSGTVTTTGTPSSGQIAKFSGSTSITTATAGTDYAAPTSGSAILKGNGAGGFSSAAAGTDYVAATSGSAIQKANGAGGLTAATSGTDYAPATSGSAILKGNAAGGTAAVTVAARLNFTGSTLDLTSGVATPATCTLATVTIDTYGRTTSCTTGTGGSSAFPFVQEYQTNSGGNTTSFTITFPQTTAASGNTAFLVVATDGSQTFTAPTGWTIDINQQAPTYARFMLLHKTTASDTSVTFTAGVTTSFSVAFFEMSGAHALDVSSTGATTNAQVVTLPAITPTTGALVFGVAAEVGNTGGSNAIPSFSSAWNTASVLTAGSGGRLLYSHMGVFKGSGTSIRPPNIDNAGTALFAGGGIAYASFSIL